MALGHVTPEARALVHPKHAVDAAHDSPDNATDYTANRPRRPLAIARSALDTSGHPLRGRHRRAWPRRPRQRQP